ncbi:MAG: hypothetical protein WKF71_16025 [Pyrinomonadaceae bacterium]
MMQCRYQQSDTSLLQDVQMLQTYGGRITTELTWGETDYTQRKINHASF